MCANFVSLFLAMRMGCGACLAAAATQLWCKLVIYCSNTVLGDCSLCARDDGGDDDGWRVVVACCVCVWGSESPTLSLILLHVYAGTRAVMLHLRPSVCFMAGAGMVNVAICATTTTISP